MFPILILAIATTPMTLDQIIADLIKNQFVFTGETDAMQKERAESCKKRPRLKK